MLHTYTRLKLVCIKNQNIRKKSKFERPFDGDGQFTCQEFRKVRITERTGKEIISFDLNLFELWRYSNYGDSN